MDIPPKRNCQVKTMNSVAPFTTPRLFQDDRPNTHGLQGSRTALLLIIHPEWVFAVNLLCARPLPGAGETVADTTQALVPAPWPLGAPSFCGFSRCGPGSSHGNGPQAGPGIT